MLGDTWEHSQGTEAESKGMREAGWGNQEEPRTSG